MKKQGLLFIFSFCVFCLVLFLPVSAVSGKDAGDLAIINLPDPVLKGDLSVEECIASRRSVRSYSDKELSLEQISQLLWAAQGITNDRGYRSAPSAGAKFPLEIYLVVKQGSKKLPAGIYHYQIGKHTLKQVKKGDFSETLCVAALGQSSVSDAPVNILITAFYERTAVKYKGRAPQYVHIEVGAVCQNIYLQCESLKLGTVCIGAFYDEKVQEVLGVSDDCIPLLIMPVGNKTS